MRQQFHGVTASTPVRAERREGPLVTTVAIEVQLTSHQTLHFGLCTALIPKTLVLILNRACIAGRVVAGTFEVCNLEGEKYIISKLTDLIAKYEFASRNTTRTTFAFFACLVWKLASPASNKRNGIFHRISIATIDAIEYVFNVQNSYLAC
jgi:hypothetical protein